MPLACDTDRIEQALSSFESGCVSKQDSQPEKPDNLVHLIFLMWCSLDWRKVGQVAILMLVASFAVALALGVLAAILVGLTPEHAAGAAGIGGGVGAMVYGCLRRWAGRDRPAGGGSS